MKRTGFKRAEYERAPRSPLTALQATPNYAGPGEPQPDPKREYVRSPKLLQNVGKLGYCYLGMHFAPVCACHSNWEVHGKGGHIKADDSRVASGCLACHHELDQGHRLTEAEKQEWFWTAHVLTVQALLQRGLWPDGVPVPDTATYPFPTPAEAAT